MHDVTHHLEWRVALVAALPALCATTANDNVMIVAMIESPVGVAIAREIANEPGVDVVFAASSDLSSFSGRRQGDAEHEAL